jgi:hypothetical protein
LYDQDKRSGESAHERKLIGRADQHINKRDRPRQENENFEQIRQRTPMQFMTAHRQKRGLKNETGRNREKIETSGTKSSLPKRDDGVHNTGQETDRRKNEKMSIHREREV